MPFEYRNGLIILKVTIQNEIYDFILDTGASNVLSKELADKLKVIPLGSEEITDINKKSERLEYTKLDDIQIGGINYIGFALHLLATIGLLIFILVFKFNRLF